ncbi:MAG TPA: DUF3306 domain-containing protein [Burkholderiales bacterium]
MSEDFFRRWSRLKRETAAPVESPAENEATAAQAAAALPPLDSLSFESDFKAFMHSKVDEGVKRAALKKLFSDPRFNVMDGLDTYIDDYTKSEPMTEEFLAQLEHARRTLFVPKAEDEQPAPAASEASEEKKNVEPQQDAT